MKPSVGEAEGLEYSSKDAQGDWFDASPHTGFMASPTLTVRFSWDLNSWIGSAQTEVYVDLSIAGRGTSTALTQNFINYQWELDSVDPTRLDTVVLRSKSLTTLNNRFELWSATRGAMLAQIRDHAWTLPGSAYVSVECDEGQFEISEPLGSRFKGFLNFGTSRNFVLSGSVTGTITLEAFAGFNEFTILASWQRVDAPAMLAVLVGATKILTRAIAQHD